MMTFSLIIPVYNAQPTLRRCLDSIVNQPFSDYELLLINDGSADASGDICREYADRYPAVRYFEKENGGGSSARNLGLDEARGEYILFVDSDDFVSQDYFEIISANLEKHPSDMLMFGYKKIGSDTVQATGTFYEKSEAKIAERISAAMHAYRFSSLCSRTFRRNIIEQKKLRFNNGISIGEDQLFIFSYAMHIASISSVESALYNVDISDGNSLSRKARPYLTKQLMEVNRRMYAAYRAAEHSPEAARHYEEALSFMTYRSAYSCCKELLKFDISPKQRRREIREICSLYRQENVKPVGWKCAAIALPVRLEMNFIIDLLICCKTR